LPVIVFVPGLLLWQRKSPQEGKHCHSFDVSCLVDKSLYKELGKLGIVIFKLILGSCDDNTAFPGQ
jgi:hypothetical protein